MLNFYNVVKKIFIQLQMFTESTLPTVGKDATAGYAHTFSDCHGIDLTALSAFPTDQQIDQAAREAYNEAKNLLYILGVLPDLFTGPSAGATPTATPTATPLEQADEPNDYDSDSEETIDDAAEISYLYKCAELLEGSSISPDHQRVVKDLSYASVMLHAHQDLDT